MAYVDFKVTSWDRLWIPDNQLDKAKELIQSGKIQTLGDAVTELSVDDPSTELIEGSVEQMCPAENDGQSTIELLDANEDTVCDNSTS